LSFLHSSFIGSYLRSLQEPNPHLINLYQCRLEFSLEFQPMDSIISKLQAMLPRRKLITFIMPTPLLLKASIAFKLILPLSLLFFTSVVLASS